MPQMFSDLSLTSVGFVFFVAVVLAIYYASPAGWQSPILLAASLVFCATWDWSFATTLITATLINYALGMQISRSAMPARSRWLYLGITVNVSLLFVFKYFRETQDYLQLILTRIGGTGLSIDFDILQPIGLSFYILQAISYLVDIQRRQIPANHDLVEVALYLAYFPKLLAGPIERAQDFFLQLRSARALTNERLTAAFSKIFVGLLRKLVISNIVAKFIPASIFTDPFLYSLPDLLFWWIVFAFVIYNDFAGYSYIARGVSELFGIDLANNFSAPFFSRSYIDFWNRWHISFSNWLRDYIYMPLSRAMLRRNPSGRHWPNLVVPSLATMLVSGIWHGMRPHFIFWGILNGLLQGAERAFKSRAARRPGPIAVPRYRQALTIAGTMLVLLLAAVPFKLEVPETFMFWQGMLRWTDARALPFHHIIKPILGIGLSFILDIIQSSDGRELNLSWIARPAQSLLIAAGLLLLFLVTRHQPVEPFIYQGF